jgi:NAD(P)-dependent dehydrogenase (short-subunit alcohol dehydrogenase family)
MDIAGNVFLVSGAASGLGAATVRMLAAQGGRVVAADVQDKAGAALAEELGVAVRFVRCDVTAESDCAQAVALAAALGPVRGLVNCAGIAAAEKTVGRDGPHGLASFTRIVQVNLVGTFNLLRLAAAQMAREPACAEGERGVIVNTASIAAFDGQIGQAAYAASKGGVAAMTLPIARDLARAGIRCVTIAPGLFETPMMAGMAPEVQAALGAQVPFPARLGRPEEFAQMVKAVLANVLLNGTVVRLDGALRMAPK